MPSRSPTFIDRLDHLEELHRNMRRLFDSAAFEIEGEILSLRKAASASTKQDSIERSAPTTRRSTRVAKKIRQSATANKRIGAQASAESGTSSAKKAAANPGAASRTTPTPKNTTPTATAKTTPPPLELVLLDVLAKTGTAVPKTELRQAAIAAGRHRSGADKAIGMMKERGFASQDKRTFVITEHGRKRERDLRRNWTSKNAA